MTPLDFGPFASIGVEDKSGNLIAGALYNNYQGFDMNFTLATSSPRWAQRGVIAAFLAYPFNQRGCTRLTMVIGTDNPRAMKLPLWLGFKIEGIAKRFYDGVRDAYIIGLMREDAGKWIKLK
jgi:RimJ/RimL family protein N-acetyltransferase